MGQGWDALNAAIATAGAEIAAVAPDSASAAEGEAYLMRVAASCLADGFLNHVFTEGGLMGVLPTRGGPNPDYLMSRTRIDATRRYRVEGRLNGSERVGVGLYTVGAGGVVLLAGYKAFDGGNTGADGRFALELAPDASGPDALPIPPDAQTLIVRILHRDPEATPARVTLSGGAATPDLTLATGTTDGALSQAAAALLRTVRQFIVWSRETSALPNRFARPSAALAAQVQGDPDTLYFLGYYDLGEGEWLETLMPAGLASYWSIQACNHWLEPLPGASIHDLNAQAEADGRIRLRIGPGLPPDLPNRIDTLGRRRGVLICRFIGAAATGCPQTVVRSG
jgi:hypothetical protein